MIALVDQLNVEPERWEQLRRTLTSGTQKERGSGANMLGLGFTEIEAQWDLGVEIFGRQIEAQNCADLL